MTGVSFRWPGHQGFGLALDHFSVAAGESLLLTGPSGSGKSTLLSLLCGVVTPSQGQVVILDTEMTSLSAVERDRFRAEHFGIIFQMFNLLPYLSILDNVLLPLSFAKGRRAKILSDGGTPQAEARRLLASLGLDADRFANQPAASLSVGQQQRVAAARALIGAPEIVVADEPTSALDRNRQREFLDLLFQDVGAAGASLIMVSHDETLAPRFDRVLPLQEIAEVVEEGRG
ncbi:MAG: ABC transporter ATP-binding protein [Pseudomonadota bacterium]